MNAAEYDTNRTSCGLTKQTKEIVGASFGLQALEKVVQLGAATMVGAV